MPENQRGKKDGRMPENQRGKKDGRMPENQRGEAEEPRLIPIKYEVPPEVVSSYATNIVVQSGPHELFLNFFEIRKPLIIGSEGEAKAQWMQVESMETKCVARIIVPLPAVPGFLNAIQTNLNKAIAELQKEEEARKAEKNESAGD